jgi:hypothetical protein
MNHHNKTAYVSAAVHEALRHLAATQRRTVAATLDEILCRELGVESGVMRGRGRPRKFTPVERPTVLPSVPADYEEGKK